MNPNNSTNNNSNPGSTPTPNASTPPPTASSSTKDSTQPSIQTTPTFTTLNVPVLSPTHFDGPAYNSTPNTTVQSSTTPAKSKEDLEKSVKKFTIISIVTSVAAAIFLILGIWGIVSSISASDNLSKAQATLDAQAAIISTVEESTGVEISSPADVPIYKATTGYVYISDWGIKLKIPADLVNLSYILDQKDYHPTICFNGLKKGVQYFPDFADILKNPGGMGCLRRVPVREGNNDAVTGLSYGTPVFTADDYNYFYVAPAKVYSSSTAEQGLESTAVQLIKNMLTGNISTYN